MDRVGDGRARIAAWCVDPRSAAARCGPQVLAAAGASSDAAAGPDRMVLLTSGSTGGPRGGACATRAPWTAVLTPPWSGRSYRLRADDVVWAPGPAGSTLTLFAGWHALATGRPLVTGRWRGLARAPHAAMPTVLHAVPAVLPTSCSRRARPAGCRGCGWRSSAGAHLPRRAARAARRRRRRRGWSSTTAPRSCPSSRWTPTARGLRPFPGVQVRAPRRARRARCRPGRGRGTCALRRATGRSTCRRRAGRSGGTRTAGRRSATARGCGRTAPCRCSGAATAASTSAATGAGWTTSRRCWRRARGRSSGLRRRAAPAARQPLVALSGAAPGAGPAAASCAAAARAALPGRPGRRAGCCSTTCPATTGRQARAAADRARRVTRPGGTPGDRQPRPYSHRRWIAVAPSSWPPGARRSPPPAARSSGVDAAGLAGPVLAALVDDLHGAVTAPCGRGDVRVDDVVLGNCCGPGGDVARVAALAAGLGVDVPGRHRRPAVRVAGWRRCGSRAALVAGGGGRGPGRRRREREHRAVAMTRSTARRRAAALHRGRRSRPPASPDPDMGEAAEAVADAVRHHPGAAGRLRRALARPRRGAPPRPGGSTHELVPVGGVGTRRPAAARTSTPPALARLPAGVRRPAAP